MTGTLYSGATARVWSASEIEPAIVAWQARGSQRGDLWTFGSMQKVGWRNGARTGNLLSA